MSQQFISINEKSQGMVDKALVLKSYDEPYNTFEVLSCTQIENNSIVDF